jgi:hypothetical protein
MRCEHAALARSKLWRMAGILGAIGGSGHPMSLTALWIGMSIGTFLYHWGAHGTWRDAIDDSYTIGMTLVAVWVMMKIKGAAFTSTNREPGK